MRARVDAGGLLAQGGGLHDADVPAGRVHRRRHPRRDEGRAGRLSAGVSTSISSWRRSSGSRSPAATPRGQGGALGGLGHFAVGVRGNVFYGKLPDVDEFSAPEHRTARSSSRCPTQEPDRSDCRPPTRRSACSRAFRSALTNVGGIDLLVSATYVPTFDDRTMSQRHAGERTSSSAVARASGCCQESIVVPGVASRDSSAICRRRRSSDQSSGVDAATSTTSR